MRVAVRDRTDDLVHVASGFLVKLWRCTNCGALWRIDEFDKYQERMIVRVLDLASWETFDDRSVRIGNRSGPLLSA